MTRSRAIVPSIKCRLDKKMVFISYTKFMAERTLYYWGKMYTENIQTGDSYSKLKKFVTINILDFISLPLDKPYSKF